MALKLTDLYEEFQSTFQLSLAAGGAGLSGRIKWVYTGEDYTTANFLRGGELVITTGVVSGNDPAWLLRFLRHMTKQNTCGLVLNLGPYLREDILTPEVLSFCEENRYPLFLMPWHIHIYDITRTFCERIFLDTRRSEEVRNAFEALLTDPGPDRRLFDRLEAAGFLSHRDYYTAALRSGDNDTLQSRGEELLSSGCALIHGSVCLVVVPCRSREEAEHVCRSLTGACPDSRCGIGSRAEGFSALYDSCRRAMDMLRLAEQEEVPLMSYEAAGIFRLFTEVSDRSALRSYCDSLLHPAEEYDRQHGTDLTHTLFLYVLYNGSIQEIAAAAFCHRNTINHRVRILKEELGYALSDTGTRLELLAAFQAKKFLKGTQPD